MTQIAKSSGSFVVILTSGLSLWADFGTSIFRLLRQKKLLKKVEERATEAIRIGVPWWLSHLKTPCCHYHGLGCCCGRGSVPGLGTPSAAGVAKKIQRTNWLTVSTVLSCKSL